MRAAAPGQESGGRYGGVHFEHDPRDHHGQPRERSSAHTGSRCSETGGHQQIKVQWMSYKLIVFRKKRSTSTRDVMVTDWLKICTSETQWQYTMMTSPWRNYIFYYQHIQCVLSQGCPLFTTVSTSTCFSANQCARPKQLPTCFRRSGPTKTWEPVC